MAVFGMGNKGKSSKKKATKKAKSSQSAAAKAMLTKMRAKKNSGECAFC